MDVDGRSSTKFDYLVERVSKKISLWKFSCLSQGGKLILMNSIIIAMASHVMALYLVPKGVLKRISSLFTKFFWASSMEKTPVYWRARTLLEKHTSEGGLSLRNVEKLNVALVGKQAWSIHNNPHCLVGRVVTGKYRYSPIIMARNGMTLGRVSLSFKSMVRAADKLNMGVGMLIGDGNNIDIEQDVWVRGEKVKKKIGANPSLRWVSDLLTSDGQWNPTTIWISFDGRTSRRILSLYVNDGSGEDEVVWKLSPNGYYFVKSGYALLMGRRREGRGNPSFWNFFWKMKILKPWKIFLWKLINRSLPSCTNL